MDGKTLKDYLEALTKDELIKKMKIAGLKYSGLDKPTVAGILNEYLHDEQNIERIWNSLSPFENEYMDEFLKYDEVPSYDKQNAMYKKYEIKGNYLSDPWKEKSNISLLFVGQTVPQQVKELLKKYIPPIVIKYEALEQLPEDSKRRFHIICESFAEDFCGVINLTRNIRLPLTPGKQLPSKSSFVQINSVLLNKDFVFEWLGGIDKIQSFEDTNRIYGIYMLLREAELISENGGRVNSSEKAKEFLDLRIEDKCRYVFEHYMKSQRIYELGRITESEYRAETNGNMTECRTTIIEHLKNCPVGMWISTSQFIDYIKIFDKKFLINQVEYITCFSDKHRMYLEPWVGWEEIEGRFIEVVLQEYLGALGIVDTVIYESEGGCSDYDENPFFKVDYFRITPLGAIVLDMEKEYHYDDQKSKSGFTFESDMQIKVMKESQNQVHKLFFERFAYQEECPQYCLFRISFAAVVKALNMGISIESIRKYICDNSYNGIPSELDSLLGKWKRNSEKVIIKNIMVLQTESTELMEELQQELNLKKYRASDLTNAFEIDASVASKVKQEVEKKEYYCKILL